MYLTTQYYPDYPLRILDINGSVGAFLIETLKRYKSIKAQNYSTILRIVCVGNDMQFNKFVNQYAQTWELLNTKEYSKLYNVNTKVEVRMYLIPHEFNSLAQYIATYDDVYNQEIFTPFIKDPLLPKLNPEVQKKGPSADEGTHLKPQWKATHIQAARDRQVQVYLREAVRFVHAKVCRAELVKGQDEPVIVYFVCRAEVGGSSSYCKEPGLGVHTGLGEMGENCCDRECGFPISLK